MSGTKYLLDTNAVISLLIGNLQVQEQIEHADWIGISIISVIQYLSFAPLSFNDKNLFYTFLSRVEIIELLKNDLALAEKIAEFKSLHRLKLPDAIIAVSTIESQAVLLSNDKHFTPSMLTVQTY